MEQHGSSDYRRRHRRINSRPDAASRRHRMPNFRGGARTQGGRRRHQHAAACLARVMRAWAGGCARESGGHHARILLLQSLRPIHLQRTGRAISPATTCRSSRFIAAICRWSCSRPSLRAPARTRSSSATSVRASTMTGPRRLPISRTSMASRCHLSRAASRSAPKASTRCCASSFIRTRGRRNIPASTCGAA